MTSDRLSDFLEALDGAYLRVPCQVLPNAIWKTRRALVQGTFEGTVTVEGGQVCRLVARTGARGAATLSVFWTRNREERVPPQNLEGVTLALLHADCVTPEVRVAFEQCERYFRLCTQGGPDRDPHIPTRFRFAPVALPSEARTVADLIDRCYEDLGPAPATVEGWTHHPTFSADLWVWIVDTATDTPAALGIAEFDSRINEGSLEWVQVLPEYRGQGLGSGLVRELLRRLNERAAFVTVSGRVDAVTRPEVVSPEAVSPEAVSPEAVSPEAVSPEAVSPEAVGPEAVGPEAVGPETVYRRCGFRGRDVWYVLRR